MSSTAKIEFFEFTLKSKDNEKKTFRQFMLDTGKAGKKDSEDQIFVKLYKYFMEAPTKGYAQCNNKAFTVVRNTKYNKHLDKRPKPNLAENTISGVVNGGEYGKERILSDLSDNSGEETINSTKSILDYFYIFAYFPLDYNRGLLIVHSNSASDSISSLMRSHVSNIFTNKAFGYLKPKMIKFCPREFQDEFKKGATISGITFRKSILSTDISEEAIRDELKEYDIKIEAIPKNKKIPIEKAGFFVKYLSNKFFGSKELQYKLSEFEDTKMSAHNSETRSNKTFEWNSRDMDFSPVVYLDGRVLLDINGIPDFISLDEYCKQLFRSIKGEFRNEDVIKPIE